MSLDLYISGWAPRGTRKSWDRISINTDSAAKYLGSHTSGREVSEAVGWFDADDRMRLVVVKLSDGKGIILRKNTREWSIEFTTLPELAARQKDGAS